MINPQPVQPSRSPYSSQPGSSGSFPSQNRPAPSQNFDKPPKKRWKKVIGGVAAALLVGGATFAASTYFSLKNNIIVADEGTKNAAILGYNPDDSKQKLDPTQFKTLGDGRFNMVLVGVDKAATLTDSIQVVSIDTINKQATVTSLPRDLYVTVPGYGHTKINGAYKIAEGKKAGSGSAVLKEIVGSVLGTTITNYALIDFNGLEELVDSLGGIEVDVKEAIYDPTFPADKGDGYAPFSIKAGLQKMNGDTALRFARSRKTSSDFARSARQQQIMDAIRKKALSAGVISNPVKITNIMQSLGNSFKTDLQVDQIKTLFTIYNAIPEGKSTGLVLDTSSDLGLLTSSSDTSAGYINYPILGLDKYSQVQRWFHKNNPDPLLAKEKPTVTIANGGKATEKQLKDFADTLSDYGYVVTINKTYTSKTKATTSQLYSSKSSDKPISTNYLGTQLSLSVQKGNPLGSSSDFEIIYTPSNATPTPSPSTTKTPSR